jgi:hypothetical protein
MSFTHQHVQSVAATDWTIVHGLGFNPAITVMVMEQGKLQAILPKSVEYPAVGTVLVKFSSARSGEARLV